MYDQFFSRKVRFFVSFVFCFLAFFCYSCSNVEIVSLVSQQVSEFDLFTLDDIDSAFQNVTRLTYAQNHHLSGTNFEFGFCSVSLDDIGLYCDLL